MAWTPTWTIPAHEGYADRKIAVAWPASTGATLAFSDGQAHTLLKNIGPHDSYTLADGTVLTFGGHFDDSWTYVASGTPTGSSPNEWDGPYALIPKNSIDLKDEAIASNVRPWADSSGLYDVHGERYDVRFRSGGNIVLGMHVAEHAIGTVHLHPTHAARGHFQGGKARIGATATHLGIDSLYFVLPTSSDDYEFATDDGSGDSENALGGQEGAYLLLGNSGGIKTGDIGYYTQDTIYVPLATPSVVPACAWPGNNPSRAMLGFCRLFPGSSSTPVVSGGGGIPAGTFVLRYCYYKALTLATNSGTVTVTIETPLSTPAIIVSTGSSQVAFTIPQVPKDWDGVRFYATAPDPGQLMTQLATSAYSITSGTNVTLTALSGADGGGGAGITPSYGFNAWPSGTHVAKDKNAAQFYVSLIGHVSKTTDANGNFSIQEYKAGTAQGTTLAQDLETIQTPHLAVGAGGSSPSHGDVVVVHATDVNRFDYVSPSTFAGMSNPMANDGSLIGGGTSGNPVEILGPVVSGALSGGWPLYSADFQSNRTPYADPTVGSMFFYKRNNTPAAIVGQRDGYWLRDTGTSNTPQFEELSKLTSDVLVYQFELDAFGHIGTSGGGTPAFSTMAGWAAVNNIAITGDDAHFTVNCDVTTLSGGTTSLTINYAVAYANTNYRVSYGANNLATATAGACSFTKGIGSLQIAFATSPTGVHLSLDVFIQK